MAPGCATTSVYRSQDKLLQIHASFANHSWNKLQCGQYVWLKNTALELKISAATNLPVKIA
jgi:hypothetical protein